MPLPVKGLDAACSTVGQELEEARNVWHTQGLQVSLVELITKVGGLDATNVNVRAQVSLVKVKFVRVGLSFAGAG